MLPLRVLYHSAFGIRFSEVYVPELEDRIDLKRVADGYLAGISPEQEHLAFTAVDLYLWARKLSLVGLSDGAGQRPRYSLRYVWVPPPAKWFAIGSTSCFYFVFWLATINRV